MNGERCRVYEWAGVQHVTGETIRPGGLALTQQALRQAALPAGARVLDVGCGPGTTVDYLTGQGLHAVGIDPSAKLLGQGRGRSPHLPFGQAHGEMLPFGAHRFDALLAECCLSLMSDAEQALAEFARVLRPDGTLIVADMLARNPSAMAAARQLPLSCCVSRAFGRAQLERLLAEAGFDIFFWEDQSEALKQLTVQIIWEYGSLADFWRCTGEEETGVATTVSNLKPGYFLLLAKRG